MYIHTRRGRYASPSRYDDTSAGDRYIAGYVGVLDRLAIWRLTVQGGSGFVIQNILMGLVLGGTATFLIFALLHTGAFQTETQGTTTAQVVAIISCFVIGIGAIVFYFYDLFQIIEHNRGPTVWLSEVALARPRLLSRIMFVDKARALRSIATGRGNSSDAIDRDRVAVRGALVRFAHSKRTINAFLRNGWVCEAERLIASRPENPSDEDKRVVENIKSQLDARAQVVREVCQARVDRDNGVTIARSEAQVDSWRQSATKFVAKPSK